MLMMEATQRILQVKEMRRVERRDQQPQGMTKLESKLCHGAHWDYESYDDNGFSLTFSKNVKWLEPRDKDAQEQLAVRWRGAPVKLGTEFRPR